MKKAQKDKYERRRRVSTTQPTATRGNNGTCNMLILAGFVLEGILTAFMVYLKRKEGCDC